MTSVDDCVNEIKQKILAETKKLFLWPRFTCLEYDDKKQEWRTARMQGIIVDEGVVILKEGLFAMSIAELPLWNSRKELLSYYLTHGSLALWRINQAGEYVSKGYLELFEETRNNVRKY
ncbi:hypothetical protein HY484_04170 [Candidatus Woesearchaeota archaeon]|nr:hypothetical protein [Candidatus Woesearchaeota archaeon]